LSSSELDAAACDAEWVLPATRGTPAQALARIGRLCAGMPDLFSAMFAVLGTHQGVSREILALAIKQCRPDIADLSRDDVVALLTSIWNGGRPGFDAVLRSRRRGSERSAAVLPWQTG
jgi:hypothetical protein